MKEKMDLAAQMVETNMFPTDFVYDHLFHLSEDQYDDYRDLIREDAKRKFRLSQIEAEGNDPVESGKSYGTPHDLASLYGTGRMDSDPANVPKGYDKDKAEVGRPEEKVSNRNTQEDNFGKDRLGREGMKKDYNDNSKLKENTHFLAHQNMLKNISLPLSNKKEMIFEEDKKGDSLLDESNIKE